MNVEVEGEPVKVLYRNHAGSVRERTLVPVELWHGSTRWHPEPQWFIKCWDEEDGHTKDFTLLGFLGPSPQKGGG